jgi:hypothetical protein
MSSYKKSVAVNIPCNNMSKITRAGETFGYSTEYLNEQFLAGQRISLDKIIDKKEEIIGCHQEIELELERGY